MDIKETSYHALTSTTDEGPKTTNSIDSGHQGDQLPLTSTTDKGPNTTNAVNNRHQGDQLPLTSTTDKGPKTTNTTDNGPKTIKIVMCFRDHCGDRLPHHLSHDPIPVEEDPHRRRADQGGQQVR